LESISGHGLTCGGIVLNNHPSDAADPAAGGNRRLLPMLTKVPILFEIEPNQATLDLEVA
jgi:hypothetical protein